ncbi:MAG: phosphopantothenoylcysteine decarboxylase [Dehalococcoidia bacterium]|nr:MAG: phosphopantothenoylcysteine decarboxylase [Dehalococcoidia bacterium]
MTPLNILITAGPTHEAIDPVRFITNRSTGHMGYAIAHNAQRAGHKVTLISGPVGLKPPPHAHIINVRTAREMFSAVKTHIRGKDCLIMSAAVSDFYPVAYSEGKIKRKNNPGLIRLRQNPDILSWVGNHKDSLIIVGFCMETENLLQHAKEKQKIKNTDFMVANMIRKSNTPFGAGTTSVVILCPDNKMLRLNNISKAKVAGILLDIIQKLWYKKHSGRGRNVPGVVHKR